MQILKYLVNRRCKHWVICWDGCETPPTSWPCVWYSGRTTCPPACPPRWWQGCTAAAARPRTARDCSLSYGHWSSTRWPHPVTPGSKYFISYILEAVTWLQSQLTVSDDAAEAVKHLLVILTQHRSKTLNR